MKTIGTYIMMLFMVPFLATANANATASSDNCDATLSIIDPEDLHGAALAISAAFADYSSYYDATDDVYYLNIGGDPGLDEDVLEMDRNFTLDVSADETKDIYLCNLNLTPAVPGETAFLGIVNRSDVTIHISGLNLTGVQNGLSLSNSGNSGVYELYGASIAGDGNKLGSCLNVAGESAIIDGGTFTGCQIGINITADDVTIENSAIIYNNKIGVQIASGVTGSKISHSLVYGNALDPANPTRDDGIKVDSWDMTLYDVTTDDDGTQSAVAMDDQAVTFTSDTAYFVLPESASADGHVEFFLGTDSCIGDILPYFQTCGYADMPEASISAATLSSDNIIRYTIPPAAWNKNITAIYTNDLLGSTSISQTFKFADSVTSATIAFVASPYDILTPGEVDTGSGNNTTDSEDEEDGSNNTQGGTNQMGGEEGGDSGVQSLPSEGFSSASGCKGQIFDTNANIANAVAGMSLWWIIFSTSLLLGFRAVIVISRKR